MDGPSAQGFLSLTGPSAPRVADCPSGNAYEVSVTDLPFSVIWHEKHSADWLAALATPYPGCAIGHTFGMRVHRGQKVQRVQRVVDCPYGQYL